MYVCFAMRQWQLCSNVFRGGFRGVSEVSRNHSGFSLDDGCTPFQLQGFTKHTQWDE